MSSCFISDLHLDHKREDIKKAFEKGLSVQQILRKSFDCHVDLGQAR